MMVIASRVCVGLLLLSSGAFKAVAFDGFRMTVQAYRIVGSSMWSRIVAGIVVCCECTLGGALIVGLLPRVSSSIAFAMLIVFSLAACVVVMRGDTGVRCGCKFFGRDDRIGWHLGLRNMSLACFLLPSAWPLSGAYALLTILTGVLLLGFSVASVNPQRFRLQIARIESNASR